jgi:hypothetical protein
MAKELSRDFGYPKAQVWDALPGALQSVKMSVDSSDPAAGRIEASTGVSLSSWGENVSVQVGEAGPDKTTVTVSTKLKFGLTGWGKLKKNINRVFDSLDQSLGS